VDLVAFGRRYVVRYLPWYAAGIGALIATNLLSVTIPLHVASAIDALRAGDHVEEIVPREAAAVAAMGILVIVVRTASRVLFFNPGRYVEAELRHDLFAAVLRQQPAFLRKYPPGDLVSRASSDVGNVRLLVGFGVLQVVNTFLAVVFAGAQMFRISPILALWTLAPIVVALFLTQLGIRRLYVLMRRLQEQTAALSDHVLSSYQGVATIHGFVAEGAFEKRFDDANQAYQKTAIERSNLRVALGPLLTLAATLNVFVLLWVGGPMTAAGTLTVGELVAWITLVALLVSPLRGISFVLQIWKQSQVGLERLGDVMDPPPDRPDLPDPRPTPASAPGIEVRGLTFAYPDAPDEPVLRDVSLSVAPGTTLGILGATGSGKTTLLRCLSRLYNPPPGTVLVDGADVRTLDLDAWRKRLAVVPQRAFLFSEPLDENVLLGAPDDGRLDALLKATTLDVDVAQLPQGTKTVVGESGILLSGGQRQRVALARGLVRPHAVLLLDDVLSAVDHHTEHELIETLRRRPDHPTTIIVSHRISALQHADRIVVLDGGRVVDQGTHAELIRRPGFYRETWEQQISAGEAK
jgi:ATP-binding cassette subfamily B multidrug efflux pump